MSVPYAQVNAPAAETNYGNPEAVSAERIYAEGQKIAELREAAIQRLTFTITNLEEQVKALYRLQERLVHPPASEAPPPCQPPGAYQHRG